MYIVVLMVISSKEFTWRNFQSKKRFNDWWTSSNALNRYEIVEEGVTEEKAKEFCLTSKEKIRNALS